MSAEVIPLRRHDLNEGDCVRLKSGGPLMIVAIADGEVERGVQVIWIDRRRLKHEWRDARVFDLVARAEPS